MPSTNTVEIVEALIFGILAVAMWIFSVFWSSSKTYSAQRNNQQRVLKTTAWLYGWASFFIMTAALVLVLGAGTIVRSDGFKAEWIRWAGFILAGTFVAITVMFYYEFERWPDLIMWSFLVAVSWAFGLGLVITGGTKFCALFTILGLFIMAGFGFWLFVQSRIKWYRLQDFVPSGLYIFFSLLIWINLWLGPAGAKVLSRSWEIAIYIILWFLMTMLISVFVWIFYRGRKLNGELNSAVKHYRDQENDKTKDVTSRLTYSNTIKPASLPTTRQYSSRPDPNQAAHYNQPISHSNGVYSYVP